MYLCTEDAAGWIHLHRFQLVAGAIPGQGQAAFESFPCLSLHAVQEKPRVVAVLRQQLRRRRHKVGAVGRERGGHEVLLLDGAARGLAAQLALRQQVAHLGGDVPHEDALHGGCRRKLGWPRAET